MWYLLVMGVIMCCLIIYCFLIEVNWIRIDYHKINKQKSDAKEGIVLRVVQVSDIHGKCKYFKGNISDIVNELKPDFILLTGDLLDRFNELSYVTNELSRMKAKQAIIFIKGNHEIYESGFFGGKRYIDTPAIIEKLREADIKVLDNEYIEYGISGRKLLIYGIDNSDYNVEKDIEGAKISNYDFSLVMAHMPDSYHYLNSKGVVADLFLSGHTHGGQINIPFLFKIAERILDHKGFEAGIFIDGKNRIFNISRGLGNTTLKARFLNRPEINVFDINL